MLLLTRPASYDVVVTENLFGDILTDEAAAVEAAVEHVLRAGPYTSDLGGRAGTAEVRDAVLAALSSHATGSATPTKATDSCCG
jgi:3-isopropylmalate dehydrogenase